MNRLLFFTKVSLVCVVFSCFLSTPSYGHVHKSLEKWYKAPKVKLSEDVLESRLKNISSEVNLTITPEVRRRIKEYTVSYTESSESILGRVMLYFPIFEKEIKERNLPEELMYVAVVESLLKPEGTSKSGAAGLWQIMKSTGRWLGLKINNEVDERRDPVKSTKAALDYLEYLNNSFGDWTLAIAAYNCGPGNMRKAIRLGGSRDFNVISKYLPGETQNYIPRFVAAAYLMNYYHLHNLQPNTPNENFRNTTRVFIDEGISFTKLESQLNLDKGILSKLNPSFIQRRTSLSNNENELLIPTSTKKRYLMIYEPESYDELLAEQTKLIIDDDVTLSPSDSLRHIGSLVSNFIDIIYPGDGATYNIPQSLRSNLSYLRA